MRGNSSVRTVRGLKYVSLCERSGYGYAAKGYLRGLRNAGFPVTWTPMVRARKGYEPFFGAQVGDAEMDALCNTKIHYDAVVIHTVPEYFPFWVEREAGVKTVGYTVWETDKLPRHWPALLNCVDVLLVPCRWNKQVFAECGVTRPIEVIPHIAPHTTPTRPGRLWDLRPEDFVFYTIETWTARKAVSNTLRCYLETFTASDPTVLVIKTSADDYTRRVLPRVYRSSTSAVRRILAEYSRPAKVRLLAREVSDEQISRIHQRGDCYVSLCRSEGWGLGPFHAAALGKSIIITGLGGHLDYLPPSLAHLVDYQLISVADEVGKRSYSPDQRWAEPDLDHASRLMRRVYEMRDDAKARGELLKNHVRANFSETAIVARLLRAVAGQLG